MQVPHRSATGLGQADALEAERILNEVTPASRRMYFDWDGQPIGLGTWARLFESPDRLIALSRPTPYVTVSTVWLGIDHGWMGGPPIIYETMVFCDDKLSRWDTWCDRYSTLKQAREGHERVVRSVAFEEDPYGSMPYLAEGPLGSLIGVL